MAKKIVKTKLYWKLIEALDCLELAGIIYNAGSGYTQNDAMDDLSEKFGKFTAEARKAVWGYCLFHEQYVGWVYSPTDCIYDNYNGR